jgi:Lon-like protease
VRPSGRWLALAGLFAAALFAASTIPSGDYLFVPNEAEPIAAKVTVDGRPDPEDGGGIYYVEVTLKKARWFERALPFLRPDGSSLVPGHAVTAPGETFKDRIAEARSEMDRSERIAAAVALRAGGLHVEARPRGVLIQWVAVDAPSARTLRSGDVIVEAAGQRVLTPNSLRRAVSSLTPGDEVGLRFRRSGRILERTVRTVAAADDANRAIIGIQVSQDAAIKLPLHVGNDVDRGYRVAATGAIELDGTIVGVGGIKQKVYGVRSSGADVFLVPAGDNVTIARRYAGGLRIIPVESFEQALRALQTLPKK